MNAYKYAGIAVASVALAVPAAGLAARQVTPRTGSFKGTVTYPFQDITATAPLALTVSNGQISRVVLGPTAYLPSDPSTSHGNACGSASSIDTKGYKRSGTTSTSGQFSYTFAKKFASGISDKVTVVGKFTDSTHATGTFRDIENIPPAMSYCDSGKIKFKVTHS